MAIDFKFMGTNDWWNNWLGITAEEEEAGKA